MRYKCRISGCRALAGGGKETADETLSVHQLPVREDIRAKWLEFIGITAAEANESIRVCSKHFTEDQFKANCYQRRLIAGAVPTIYSPSSGDATSTRPRVTKPRLAPASSSNNQDLASSSCDPTAVVETPVAVCTLNFLKRFQENLPNYTLTRDAAQNVQIKILATLPETTDPIVKQLQNTMQSVASFHVLLTKFQSLYTTKTQELTKNVAELSTLSAGLSDILETVQSAFHSFSMTFASLTTHSQNFIVEAIEMNEKYASKSEELHQQVVLMDKNIWEALILKKSLFQMLRLLREHRRNGALVIDSESDENDNVSLEIFLINYDFLMDEIEKYVTTCSNHLYFLRNPINFLYDRVKFLKKNFGDRLEHTLVPYVISRDKKTQLIVVKIPKTPEQPTVKNEEYVIKIMQLAASLYVHLSKSEKEIVTKCLEVGACIDSLSTLCGNSVSTLQNIQTRIRATSKQISKLVYYTIRLMNTAIDIKASFNPVNITPLVTALRSVAGYTSMALESIYLVENLVKELKERRDDIRKLDDEHNFLKETFIINLDILLDMVEKYTLLAGQHLNLQRYKLYFLREYVKQFPAPPKRRAEDEPNYRSKKKRQLQVITCKNSEEAAEDAVETEPNFDLALLHAAMENVLEIDLPKPLDSFGCTEELEESIIKKEQKDDEEKVEEIPENEPVIKTEPEPEIPEVEEPDFYIKPEPLDIDDNDEDSLQSLNMPEGNFSVYTEQLVDGFIIREIKEEEAVDYC